MLSPSQRGNLNILPELIQALCPAETTPTPGSSVIKTPLKVEHARNRNGLLGLAVTYVAQPLLPFPG